MGRLFAVVGLAVLLADQGDYDLVGGRVPLWLKVFHTLFLGVLVPVYWRCYGPANFLWFSDIALLVTLPALWLEDCFLASMQAVSVGLLELLWLTDFLVRLVVGIQLVGISKYMFDASIPLGLRALSLFHVWLPLQLLWLVWQLGYDWRGWVAQTVFALVILTVCYFATSPAANINWVFGPGEKPQRVLPPGWYLVLLMLFLSVCVYLPSHLVLWWFFPEC